MNRHLDDIDESDGCIEIAEKLELKRRGLHG